MSTKQQKQKQKAPSSTKQTPHQGHRNELQQQAVPTTKQQLIELLKSQLQKVEDRMKYRTCRIHFSSKNKKGKSLQCSLRKNRKKQKNYSRTKAKHQAIAQKVHEGLFNTLEAANRMRAEADAEIRRLAEDNTVLNQKIVHRDNSACEDRSTIIVNSKKIGSLEQKKIDQQRRKDNLIDKKQNLRKDFEQMKQEHERIEREQKELRNHIENMKKLRMYLNKNLQGNVKAGSYVKPAKASVPDSFWNA